MSRALSTKSETGCLRLCRRMATRVEMECSGFGGGGKRCRRFFKSGRGPPRESQGNAWVSLSRRRFFSSVVTHLVEFGLRWAAAAPHNHIRHCALRDFPVRSDGSFDQYGAFYLALFSPEKDCPVADSESLGHLACG